MTYQRCDPSLTPLHTSHDFLTVYILVLALATHLSETECNSIAFLSLSRYHLVSAWLLTFLELLRLKIFGQQIRFR